MKTLQPSLKLPSIQSKRGCDLQRGHQCDDNDCTQHKQKATFCTLGRVTVIITGKSDKMMVFVLQRDQCDELD